MKNILACALLLASTGCALHRPLGPHDFEQGSRMIAQEMIKAPYVELRNDQFDALKALAFEVGAKTTQPADYDREHDGDLLVISVQESGHQTWLYQWCIDFAIELSHGYYGSPFMRGQGEGCYEPGLSDAHARSRALKEAIGNLHHPALRE